MKPPTLEEIAAELAALKDMAPRIRQRDAFGGDNRAGIDAQIRVIERGMSESAIYDKWDDANAGDVASSAIEARQWLDGEAEDGAPSEAWRGLLQR